MGNLLGKFIEEVDAFGPCRMLHMGSKRSNAARSTFEIEKSWFGPHVEHVGTDVEYGLDVDVVCDAHDMDPEYFGYQDFDFVVSCSVLEHLRKPWVVAEQIALNVRRGGLLFVQTHQTFPIHDAYGGDYFRFSAEALRSIFDSSTWWETVEAEYEFPCRIIPPPEVQVWNESAPAFLNVCALARRL